MSEWSLIREIHPEQQGVPLRVKRVACCPNGDIVVTEWNKIYIIDRHGKYKLPLNLPGTDPDEQIYWLRSVAVSPQGHIFVVDITKYVKVFDVKGKYLHCFNVLGDDPNANVLLQCVGVDNDRQILVTDGCRNLFTIHECPDGKVVNKIKYKIGADGTMAVNSKKQILYHFRPYDSVYSKVVALDYTGNEIFAFIPKINEDVENERVRARGIVCDDADNIYIAMEASRQDNTGHIHKYSPTGEFLQCIVKGLYWPSDLSIASDGKLVVANFKTILVYSGK